MTSQPTQFRLKVQQIAQVCLFELSWGEGQSLTVRVDYPPLLTRLYQTWQRAYLSFYRSDEMRGRTVGSGDVDVQVNWHGELVKAEAKLMAEFDRWLRCAELYELRNRITSAAQQTSSSEPVTVFLTCAPLELARLAWEAWELGSDPATNGKIRIIRTPLNVTAPTVSSTQRRSRPQILAILGDETGLNFQADREAVQSLLKLAEVEFVGWQPGQVAVQIRQQIRQAIDHPAGWDLLFFAGHSNETELTGGELGVAPGVSISISEIVPVLQRAKQRGLQVAIFNSCSGLSLADALVNLGFSQVMIMREPIHNRVAQTFLIQFFQALAQHQDVQQALTSVQQQLRLEQNQTYPSAYLIPSLFCHPSARLFQIPLTGWKQRLQQSLPTRLEALVLASCVLLSSVPPIQSSLLHLRLYSQAMYRNLTAQVPSDPPSVALVQIDTQSIFAAKISQVHPIDRRYVAQLVQQAQVLDPSILAVDVLLDTPDTLQPQRDQALSQAAQTAVEQNTWLLFAAILEETGELGINDATGIANPNWSLQAYIDVYDPYSIMLPAAKEDCRRTCPFAFLAALTRLAQQEIPAALPHPQLNRSTDLRSDLIQAIEQSNSPRLRHLYQTRLQWVHFWTPWLRPIIDFSLPPDRIYQTIPAWSLAQPNLKLTTQPQPIVIIAAGDDERFGITAGQGDRSPVPLAIHYWRNQQWLTGGESLAYMVHHLLTQRLVIPIPDLWLIGLAALLGKLSAIGLKRHPISGTRLRLGLVGITAAYAIARAQLYVASVILLPWLLPSCVFWTYVSLAVKRRI